MTAYSIGEISKMFNIPVSTLRYYDKEGLFPEITRVSGIRKFSNNEIEALRVIECLKKSGLEIKD
ncbi:MerR family transcriptional regulator, partial [Enterococcus faecalis]|nr:MerR family transcriptional regulator [Enterococcus faecalis]